MLISDKLSQIKSLAFDTSPLIYFVEAHPKFDSLLIEIFDAIAKGKIKGITSMITLTEVMVMPLTKNDSNLVALYSQLLVNSSDFSTVSIGFDVSLKAAMLRSKYKIKTPDALQIATALHTNCDAFLTNDIALKKVEEIEVLILDEFQI